MELPVDRLGDSTLEAAHGFGDGLILFAFAFVVGAGVGMPADLGERDGVQRPVELAVAAPVEPMPLGACGVSKLDHALDQRFRAGELPPL